MNARILAFLILVLLLASVPVALADTMGPADAADVLPITQPMYSWCHEDLVRVYQCNDGLVHYGVATGIGWTDRVIPLLTPAVPKAFYGCTVMVQATDNGEYLYVTYQGGREWGLPMQAIKTFAPVVVR